MQWNGMTFPIRLKNISTGGALIESERGVPLNSQVQLDLPDIGHFGAEVRWTNENLLTTAAETSSQSGLASAFPSPSIARILTLVSDRRERLGTHANPLRNKLKKSEIPHKTNGL